MDQRARRFGSIAGVAVAAVVGLAGCSSDADSTEDKKSPSNGSPAADTEKSGDDASASSQASTVDRSTAEKAVAGWVAAVIKGEPKDGCLLMAEPATGSKPARVGDETTCADDAPERKQMDATLGQFKESFTPEPPSADPKVEVTQAPAAGEKVEVPADKITVDGQALDKVVLSHSTGVTQDQLDIKIEASKIENSWYVTNLDFDIG